MSRKVEQGDATRRELIGAAIALFTEQGYAGTSTTQVVQRAGVTRGALYHHFPDKERLFEAAYTEIQRDIFARCSAAASAAVTDGRGPAAGILAGSGAFLDACLRPDVQRVFLREGPLVLGWRRSVRFDDPHCARRLLLAAIGAAAQDGSLPQDQVESITHLLYGALNQAGVVIADAADPAAARAELGKALGTLIRSLLGEPAPA